MARVEGSGGAFDGERSLCPMDAMAADGRKLAVNGDFQRFVVSWWFEVRRCLSRWLTRTR